MRLNTHQIGTIKAQTAAMFGQDASVRLFGSRVDDSGRGGDIDLRVSTSEPVDRPALLAANLAARLQLALGDQRIDVLVDQGSEPAGSAASAMPASIFTSCDAIIDA